MILTDPFPPALPSGWTSRVPLEADVEPVAALILADDRRSDPEATVDVDQIESRLVGLRSWSRRQVVIVRAPEQGAESADGSGAEEQAPLGEPVGWVSVEDRAAGRTNVQWVLAMDVPDRDEMVRILLAWASDVGGSFARHRGLDRTQLDATSSDQDEDRRRLLAANGYRCVRTWLHMDRPVRPEEARTTPEPRPGVRVRRVHEHASGLPLAQDVRTVHRMLEESFADHFNSYRESFAEFASRLAELRDPRWDHWWIAEVQQEDGSWLPGGGLVATVMPATPTSGEGTYLEYLGVHRSARGRGIAKALLNAAIRDAAERGRTHVGLEVDADSPTGADGLYVSMGWVAQTRTESWHSHADALPSRLLDPEVMG